MVAGTTGCGFIQKQSTDAWSVTYEVTVSGETVNALDDVTYDDAPSRGEDSEPVQVGTVATTNSIEATGEATWSATTMVTAGKRAAVSATPRDGTTATCHILLDETREIATSTGDPGAAVSCSVDTPKFVDATE